MFILKLENPFALGFLFDEILNIPYFCHFEYVKYRGKKTKQKQNQKKNEDRH